MLRSSRLTIRIPVGLLLVAFLVGCPSKGATDKTNKPSGSNGHAPDSANPNRVDADVIPDSSQMPGRVHIVEPKETLMQLAERYYKDRGQWRRIWQANKNRVSNPNDLPVGMKLIIP